MKYLHIFKNTNEIFSEPYIDFINENFNSEDHQFFHIGRDIRKKRVVRDNVNFIVNAKYLKFVLEMQKAEKIIIHGLSSPILVLVLFMQPWILRKCYWVVWGGDLYYYKTRKKTFKHNCYEKLRKHVIENFTGIITLVDNDYSIAKDYYRISGKRYAGRYINPVDLKLLNGVMKKQKKDRNTLIVQIGNSADSNNNHIEALNILSKYKYENIRIICPLSYGDESYAEKIKVYGENIFGNRFVAMTDFVDPKIYVDFLNSVDVAIFANDRQQALGNIFALTYLGKKVYIKDNISTWDYYRNKLNINIFSYSSIKNFNFLEFKAMSEDSKENNMIRIKDALDPDKIRLIWEKVFND